MTDTTSGPERDLVGYGPDPPVVVWPDDARVAVSLVVNYEEGAEYAVVDGDDQGETHGEIGYAFPAGQRDLSTESVFEYGSRVGVWRLLRLFDEYGVKTTFHAAARALERNATAAKAIVDLGHEICAHGWRWEEQWRLSREEEREHIRRAVASIRRTVGERPLGWYSRYGPSSNTRELLVEEGGFLYDSDAYNDDLPYYVEVAGKHHLVIPYTHSYNDGRFTYSPGYGSPQHFVDNCLRAVRELWREGETTPKMMSIGLHPRLVGQAGRTNALREIIESAQALGGVWFCRRIDVARLWLQQYPPRGARPDAQD
jgi:peptidoglycan/xylan/chitin deacetylase (PgdA/CDA1 family)